MDWVRNAGVVLRDDLIQKGSFRAVTLVAPGPLRGSLVVAEVVEATEGVR
jgi:hypothetical protein